LKSAGQSWGVGTLWLVLTLAFEAGLGIASGLSVPEILAQYNVLGGNLWFLVPLFVLVAPRLFYRQKGKRK
jgi:hypothetical protein